MKYILIFIALFTISFFLSAELDLFEKLYFLTRSYETFQLDEIFSTAIVFSGFLLFFSFFMNFRLSQAVAKLKQAEKDITRLNDDLENRIRVRTDELNQSNTKLRLEMDERVKIEAQLVQKQKMEAVGNMAGGIAHDFNTLLGIIIGYAGMIKKNLSAGHIAEEMSDEILDAARRSKELIRQLSDFTTPDHQEKKQMDFRRVIRDGIKLLKSALPSTIVISDTLPQTPCPIRCNAQQIIQVILNLGVNACHAMAEEGDLRIFLKQTHVDHLTAKSRDVQPGDYFTLTVQDTGCGIDARILDNIFDPFFTTKNVGEGSGLGLSVVFGILKAHKGYVSVDSRVGQGSGFHVHIPAVKTENT